MEPKMNDCYFFYYSACNKGDLCPFRHEPAALGTEMVCDLWKMGHCFKHACKFRHMDIQVNRGTTPCYWESQPGGCRKPHCVFRHQSRDGPPGTQPFANQGHQGQGANITAPNQALPISVAPSTTLEYSKQAETPRAQQVLINPFDEESDQESLKGTPVKVTRVPVKERLKAVQALQSSTKVPAVDVKPPAVSASEDQLTANFGIKSLTEIRRGKQKRAPILDDDDVEMVSVESTSTGENFGIKSLEEIRREKALESMRRRRIANVSEGRQLPTNNTNLQNKPPSVRPPDIPEQKPIQIQPEQLLDARLILAKREHSPDLDHHYVVAKEENTDPIPSSDGTRRIVISSDKDPSPTPQIVEEASQRPRLSLKERLGHKHSEESETEPVLAKGSSSLRSILDQRLARVVETEKEPEQVKLRSLSAMRKERQEKEKKTSIQEDREPEQVKLRSLSAIRKERQEKEKKASIHQDGEPEQVKLRSLSAVRKERQEKEKKASIHQDGNIKPVKVKSLGDIRKERQHKEKRNSSRKVRLADDEPEAKIEVKSLVSIRREKTIVRKHHHTSRNSEEEKIPQKSISERLGHGGERQSVRTRLGNDDTCRAPVASRLNIRRSSDEVDGLKKEESGRRATTIKRKLSRVEIYRPPAMKKRDTTEHEEVEEVVAKEPITKKKSSEWGTKTFSEIMREKQLRKQQQEEDGQTSPVKNNATKRSFSPVAFGSRSDASKDRSKFPRITFNTNTGTKQDTVGGRPKPDSRDPAQTANKPGHIVFDLEGDKKSDPVVNVKKRVKSVALPLRKKLISEIKQTSSGSNSSVTTMSNLVHNKNVKKFSRDDDGDFAKDSLASSFSLEEGIENDLPILEPPPCQISEPVSKQSPIVSSSTNNSVSKVSIRRSSQDTRKLPGSRRRSTHGSAGSTSDLKSPTDNKKTLLLCDTEEDLADRLFEEELDDLLSDVKDVPLNTSQLDNDSLLLEMEELLA